jgi:hypothetical protein
MTKQTLTALLLFVTVLMHAQKGVVTSGGKATGSGGSSSYSVGLVNFKSNTANNSNSTEGVQHAYQITEIENVQKVVKSDLSLTVYPNPTEDLVTIKIDNYVKGIMSYQLFSTSGQLIFSESASESLTTISMGNLAQGTYFIKVSCDENPIKTFKIIKN